MEVKDIKITESFEGEKPDFDFQAKIHGIFEKLPKKDLFGIAKVEVVGYAKNPNDNMEASLLHPKSKGEPAHIELCAYRILDQIPEEHRKNTEYIEAHVAYALMRSVGFNTLQFKHGISMKKAETLVAGYSRKQLKEHYAGWDVEDGIPVKA